MASKLWEHHEAIEGRLSRKVKDLFSLKETVILYDLTNTYFEGSKKGSGIAKLGGKSKERRNDRPLVPLALAVDSEGFPKLSQVLEGNVSEPKTLEGMLGKLDSLASLFNSGKTVVIDAGIATDENLALIRSRDFKYVAVSRKRSDDDDFWNGSEESRVMLADGKTSLTLRQARTDGEIFVLCHSEAKEVKEQAIYQKKMQRFEGEIEKLREGLAKKGTRKKYDKVMERIGRLKEKYGVGSLYDPTVEERGGIVTSLTLVKNDKGEAKIGQC